MTKKRLGIIGLLIFTLAAAVGAFAQSNQPFVQKELWASDYGTWQIKGSAPNTYQWQPSSLCQFPIPGGTGNFDAPNSNAPVYIMDANNAQSEVVTPSFVILNSNLCEVAMITSYNHFSFSLASGTAGLQEALNSVPAPIPYAVQVFLDRNWYTMLASIPGRNAASVIAAAKGSTAANLVDVTTVPATYYHWNGTQYVASVSSGNIGGGALGSVPYQSGPNTTVFVASPTTSGKTFVYAWTPSGSAVAPQALDFSQYMASPPPIGSGTANTGVFTNIGTPILNGVSECAAYAGSTVDAKVNACLSDAQTLANGNTSGLANAAGLGGSRFNTTAQINVGTVNGVGVGLQLPCSGVWAGTMTGGTQDVVKVWGAASIYSLCPASGLAGQFGITAAGGSNLLHVFETATSSNPYVWLQGFNVTNIGGGAATSSGVTFALTGPMNDGSALTAVNVYASLDANCVVAYNVSSATTWMHSSINCGNFGIPFYAKTDTNGYVQSLVLEDMTLVHPGTGLPAFLCTDTRAVTPHISYVAIHHSYTETGTDGVTPSIQIQGCNKVDVTDHIFKSQSSGRAPSPAEITTTNTYNTDLEVHGVIFSQGSGNYTYPVPVISNGYAITNGLEGVQYSDSLGHYGDYSPPSVPHSIGGVSLVNSTATALGFLPRSVLSGPYATYFDDFFTPVASVGVSIGAGTGQVCQGSNNTAEDVNHPGNLQAYSGTTSSTGQACVVQTSNSIAQIFTPNTAPGWTWESVVYPSVLPGTTASSYQAGMAGTPGASPWTTGIGFYLSSANGTANDWYCRYSSTSTDSGVAATVAWTRLSMVQDGTYVHWYINGTEATGCKTAIASMPSASQFPAWSAYTSTSTGVSLWVDYVNFQRQVSR